ncbi:YajQ family cyclic di-GMP-binding protein [Pelomonas sp. KK5]|uniref:YajQ family cyclic di-GMP-binding protein n=1 Tax=Pelomonas sp. KK5 TaxID=1855730 RepID=UPI00097C89A9|nr:YajQ family cyclic di-GMP-binding protein [Pelomonas sp. KK5]
MPSIDTVLEPNMVKIKNGVENSAKEIGTRFDFKGTSAKVELKEKDKAIEVVGDSDFQLEQVEQVLYAKLTKQDVVITFLEKNEKIEKLGGDKVKQVYKIKDGIEADLAKKITAAVKNSKIKVQAAFQDGKVRLTGKSIDDIQQTMALIRKEFHDVPLSFDNQRA